MPSDSVSSFLDSARDARLLPPDRLAELARDPAVPTHNLPAFAADLEARGLLTRFQAGLVGGGRSGDLIFAGYPVTDVIGPCPGGTAYVALHPILRTPVVLRRYRAEWFAPAETPEEFAARAQVACPVMHPRLAQLLDAGVANGEPFAAFEPVPGLPLDELVRDIGTMPGFLAAEFGRQIADALAAAHAKGIVHGDVRPAHLTIGPLVPTARTRPDGTAILRPAPDGAATLLELGLVSRRPPAAEWVAETIQPPELFAFLAPERTTDGTPTEAGDVFGLGATLFFALTARFPFRGTHASELVADAVASEPRRLAELRPDLPVEFAAVVQLMLSRDPDARPTAARTAELMTPFAATPNTPPAVPEAASPATSNILGEPSRRIVPITLEPADAEPVLVPFPLDDAPAEPAAPPSEEWSVTTYTGPDQSGGPIFAPPAEESTAPVRRRPAVNAAAEKQKQKMWMCAGAGLWVLSIPLWIVLLNSWGCFSSGGGTNTPESQKKGYRK